MIYNFRFISPAHHSELLPSDLGSAASIVEDLISQKLYGRSHLMIVQSVWVRFLTMEYQFVLHIAIRRLSDIASNEEDLEPYIEGLIAEALLQLFGEGVSVF